MFGLKFVEKDGHSIDFSRCCCCFCHCYWLWWCK